MEVIDTNKTKINDWSYWNRLTFSPLEDKDVYIKSSLEDLKKIQFSYTTVKDNSYLYFGKTSKFPRHKLKDTTLKRCIKVEKSDIQVVGNITFNFLEYNSIIFSNEKEDFIVIPRHIYRYGNMDFSKNDYIDRIKENNEVLKNTNATYIGKITILPKLNFEDLSNIENKVFNSIVTDKELDAFINKNAESLTIDTCDLLLDLLNSKDYQSMELGLKMLIGFNVNECPYTVKLLLRNPRLTELKAWDSVGVNQVKSSINIDEYFNIATGYNKITSDLDKTLTKHVWRKIALKEIDKYAKDFNIPGLNFKGYAE